MGGVASRVGRGFGAGRRAASPYSCAHAESRRPVVEKRVCAVATLLVEFGVVLLCQKTALKVRSSEVEVMRDEALWHLQATCR